LREKTEKGVKVRKKRGERTAERGRKEVKEGK
jgi:hypothetical protein